MTIEHASMRVVDKPWGSMDLRPWSELRHDGAAIGELWFQRADMNAPEPALLLKLLFTTQALSIQVHPNDTFAHSLGLANGKTEAWYVLSATPQARIAVGLKRRLTSLQLRSSIEDGSISEQVQWRAVLRDDVIFVPAGTIHAIGAGLVIAEIQQRSDATFRLFDYGRQRELHADNAVAAADAGPAGRQTAATRLSDARTVLVTSPHFVLERIDLPPRSTWDLHAQRETWVLVLDGRAKIGLMNAFVGEAVFLDAEQAGIEAGPEGLKGLVAYPGPEPDPSLLRRRSGQSAASSRSRKPPLLDRPARVASAAASAPRSMEARS